MGTDALVRPGRAKLGSLSLGDCNGVLWAGHPLPAMRPCVARDFGWRSGLPLRSRHSRNPAALAAEVLHRAQAPAWHDFSRADTLTKLSSRASHEVRQANFIRSRGIPTSSKHPPSSCHSGRSEESAVPCGDGHSCPPAWRVPCVALIEALKADTIHAQMFGFEEPASTGATPILDSAVLPPAPRRMKLSHVMVGAIGGLILAATIGGEYADKRLEPEYVLLLFIPVFILVIVVHELGHLVAGRIVGFHFSSLQIGPFSLQVEHGRLGMRVRRGTPFVGYAGMQVEGVRRLRRRLLLFIVAGPGANLLSVPVTVFLVNYALPGMGRSWVSIPASQFAVFSLILGLVSLLPIGANSDGGRISMLLSSFDSARRWMTIAALDGQRLKGVRPKYWKGSWLKSASWLRDGSLDELTGKWLAYIAASDRKDVLEAASDLERCLELVSPTGPSMLDVAALEAAVFIAWFRNDALVADKWSTQVKKHKQIPRLLHIRLSVALQCSRLDFTSALASWHEGLTFIDNLPATQTRDQLRDSWLEWRAEIQERRDQNAVV